MVLACTQEQLLVGRWNREGVVVGMKRAAPNRNITHTLMYWKCGRSWLGYTIGAMRDKISVCIDLFIDNSQVQSNIRTGRSVNPYSMAWLRAIYLVASMFNIELVPVRISSEENVVADALSRLNVGDSKVICHYNFSEFGHCCFQAVDSCWTSGSC